MEQLSYLHLTPGQPMPAMGEATPHRAVIVADADVTPNWRDAVSDWLVRSGCLYVMAWGICCEDWEDSADYVRPEASPDDDHLVMTTAHKNETLGEAFWFAQACAFHPTIDLQHTLILHIAASPRRQDMLKLFEASRGEQAK